MKVVIVNAKENLVSVQVKGLKVFVSDPNLVEAAKDYLAGKMTKHSFKTQFNNRVSDKGVGLEFKGVVDSKFV